MSNFDPDQFLNSETTESTDTKIVPVPMGEYLSQIEKVDFKEITINSGENAGQTRIIMSVIWDILDDAVKQELGRDKVTIRQQVWIDLSEEGAIDMSKGKNRQLGLLREAVGQNQDGKPWSPSKLIGASATVDVTHRPDKDDPEVVYSEVKKVAAA